MAFWGNITLWSEQMKTLLPATIAAAACVLLSSAGMAGQPGTSNGVNCGTTAFNTPGEGMGVQDRRSLPSPCSPPGEHSQFLFTQTRLPVVATTLKQQAIRRRPLSTTSLA